MPDLRHRRLFQAAALALVLAAPVWAQARDPAAALRKGSEALARSDGLAAEIAFKEALGAGASREAVAAGMGEALVDQGQLDKAREWLGPARFAPSDGVRGLRALARLESLQGNLSAAGKALDGALALAPRNADIWVDIAQLRYRGGEQIQAIDAVDQALAVNPNDLRAIDFRGLIVRDQLGPAEALPWFERGISLAPNDGPLMADYAASLGELGRARQMLAVIRKMLSLGVETDRAFFLQAVLAARAGDLALSRAMLNRLGDRAGRMPAGLLLDSLLDMADGNGNLAAEKLDRLAGLQPQNEEVQLLLARALYASGQQGRLLERFTAAAQRPEASTYLLTLMARSLEDLGRREDAAAYLDRAAAARPAGLDVAFEAPLRMGADEIEHGAAAVRAALRAGNVAGAADTAMQLRQRHPGLGSTAMLAGDGRFAQGRFADALGLYGEAARVRFDDALLARTVLAGARSGQGQATAAMLSVYIGSHPRSRTAARIAADYAASLGDWQRAVAILQYLRKTGSGRDARLLTDLAFAQLRSGDAASAQETAREAFALQRSSPVAAQVRALALEARKQQSFLVKSLSAQARAGI